METNDIHAALIVLGATWLRKKGCSVIATDVVSGTSETPDAIGFTSSGSILLEAKASRSDFLSDKKKHFRRRPETGMGDTRYYVVATGVATPDCLPEGWGLLIATKALTGIRMAWPSARFRMDPCAYRAETTLLVSLIRRIGQDCPSGVSVNAYRFQNPNSKTTLGIMENHPA